MATTDHLRVGDGTLLPVLYEDRVVIAIDKPAGWLLAPAGWERTHQIRVHLAAAGHPVLGGRIYGGPAETAPGLPLALRATCLEYRDLFTQRPARIEAPVADFLDLHGFRKLASSARVGWRPSGAQR